MKLSAKDRLVVFVFGVFESTLRTVGILPKVVGTQVVSISGHQALKVFYSDGSYRIETLIRVK